MPNQHTWKRNLAGYGAIILERTQEIQRNLEAETDEDLAALHAAALKASETNIGWHNYDAAQELIRLIPEIQKHRARLLATERSAA